MVVGVSRRCHAAPGTPTSTSSLLRETEKKEDSDHGQNYECGIRVGSASGVSLRLRKEGAATHTGRAVPSGTPDIGTADIGTPKVGGAEAGAPEMMSIS
jgi:hypothetical protein